MGVAAQEEGPVDALEAPILCDGLADGQDVGLIEAVGQGGAPMTGGSKRDSVPGYLRIGSKGVVSSDQRGNVDKKRVWSWAAG